MDHIGRSLLQYAADESPPTDTSNGPVPDIEDAQLKQLKIAFEDAVEAAKLEAYSVRAAVEEEASRIRALAVGSVCLSNCIST